jgi:hypothetical protein
METFQLTQDINLICITAKSFPDGINSAFIALNEIAPHSKDRDYFGLSRPNELGEITYKACAMELNPGEADKFSCESMSIKSGQYKSIVIMDFMKDPSGIGKAFQQLIAIPEIDPNGYCIEWYLNDKDVRCMVRLNN